MDVTGDSTNPTSFMPNSNSHNQKVWCMRHANETHHTRTCIMTLQDGTGLSDNPADNYKPFAHAEASGWEDNGRTLTLAVQGTKAEKNYRIDLALKHLKEDEQPWRSSTSPTWSPCRRSTGSTKPARSHPDAPLKRNENPMVCDRRMPASRKADRDKADRHARKDAKEAEEDEEDEQAYQSDEGDEIVRPKVPPSKSHVRRERKRLNDLKDKTPRISVLTNKTATDVTGTATNTNWATTDTAPAGNAATGWDDHAATAATEDAPTGDTDAAATTWQTGDAAATWQTAQMRYR
ncbi:hypothetical protein VMCG_06881 [Cytospora schulzeri]|uniref:Uncharacterized protein n=1 Tax=Cytospora schulzeri TaxID=448051 RepID=A0A423W205_9PEZI|nr:hypothetical protein VMCG_06881 [Valsa malicola]